MKRPVLPGPLLAAAVILVAAVAASTAPLLTYTLTLSAFGGAHVLCELRFVEARFAARLHTRLLVGIGTFLVLIAGLRALRAADVWTTLSSVMVELVGVVGLAALTLPALASAGVVPVLIGAAVIVAVGVGLLLAPMMTIVILACLHNWTPLGFLAEGLPEEERRWGRTLGIVALVVVPILIATGLPTALTGARWVEHTVLPTGTLADNLGAYIPAAFQQRDWAVAAFSAFVFAQSMHYAAVIGILPRLAPGGPGADAAVGLSRIPTRTWTLAVVVLSAVGFVGYTVDFREARSWYAVIAAVHAWVEVPVLLLALVPGLRPAQRAVVG